MNPPDFPAGPFKPEDGYGHDRRKQLLQVLELAPAALRQAVSGLSAPQLDTRYRNWTVRQIVHHIADSHLNAFIRFKLALTEDRPTIKPYDEGRWAQLPDARTGDIALPLALLENLHKSWLALLRGLHDDQFSRAFFHPETGKDVTLSSALAQYAWHGRHHTGQILWMRQQHRW